MSPEEQSDFADLFISCLRKPEVVDIFKGIISECFKDRLIKELENKVSILERKLEDSDQYSRRNCLKITNIAEQANEDTDAIILDMAKAMDVDIKPQDISRSHRLPTRNKKKKNRDIVIRFVTYNKRKKYYDAKNKLKDINRYKNVYINEHLTQQRTELFWMCRNYVRDKKLIGTWTRDGRIAIKQAVGGEEVVKWITHVDELNKIIPPPVGQLDDDAGTNASFQG
jgi:hypothetical protein